MAKITSLGVGSGLDLEGLVTDLMKVERLPITALKEQVTSYNTKISALGTLSSKLSALQTAAKALKPDVLQTAFSKFASYSAKLSEESIGSVTAGDGATSGSYNVNVTQLAERQKITLGHGLPATLNAGGTLTLTLGKVEGGAFVASSKPEDQKTITLTSSNNTPEGLRDAINQANIGVSATLINGDDGPRLVLTGQEGSNQAFSLAGSGLGAGGLNYDPANPGSSNFTQMTAAQDAKFTLDGIEITRSSNTIKDALNGVTLTLAKQGAATLSVTENHTDKLKSALGEFIKAYNDAIGSINSLGAYDAETKVAGALQGNRILREAQSSLRSLVAGSSSGSNLSNAINLAGIGVTLNEDGTLKLDEGKFTAAVAKDTEAVANFVAGVGSRFNDSIERIVGLSGSLKTSTDGLKTSVRDLEKRQEALELRLVSVEARYRKQFTSLDTLISQMNSTSSQLTQQLANLPKPASTSKS
jgi:flagellar hook-associated protein 2